MNRHYVFARQLVPRSHPSKYLPTIIISLTLFLCTDPLNVTQCVMQANDRGLSFACSWVPDLMIWVRMGYYGCTPSSSSPQFCENPTPSATDCIPDPRGDRRLIGANCNTWSSCLISGINGKSYSDVITSCPSNNGGFPYAYINYDCLPRK